MSGEKQERLEIASTESASFPPKIRILGGIRVFLNLVLELSLGLCVTKIRNLFVDTNRFSVLDRSNRDLLFRSDSVEFSEVTFLLDRYFQMPPSAPTPAAQSRITLNDIAEHAAVSRATVSLVLRNVRTVAPGPRIRVHNVMLLLGYSCSRLP